MQLGELAQNFLGTLVLHDGRLAVPKGPGLGVSVDTDFLDSITYWRQTVEGAGLRSAS